MACDVSGTEYVRQMFESAYMYGTGIWGMDYRDVARSEPIVQWNDVAPFVYGATLLGLLQAAMWIANAF